MVAAVRFDATAASVSPDGVIAPVISVMFAGERFKPQRAYINHSVYGDAYHMHRDLSAVTVLYYANLFWESDWGGETIFFDDNNDAQTVVSPRPGRMVVSRGAILHRGTVPTRACHEERYTVAYKLLSGNPADDPPRYRSV